MSEPKFMKMPELEVCLNQPVKIHRSTAKGEESVDAKILSLQIPWQMKVEYGEFNDGMWRGTHGQFLTFAGAVGGIRKIEKDGKIVYENNKIPVPYPQFDAFTDEGLKEMNKLRRECFGEGYSYINRT